MILYYKVFCKIIQLCFFIYYKKSPASIQCHSVFALENIYCKDNLFLCSFQKNSKYFNKLYIKQKKGYGSVSVKLNIICVSQFLDINWYEANRVFFASWLKIFVTFENCFLIKNIFIKTCTALFSIIFSHLIHFVISLPVLFFIFYSIFTTDDYLYVMLTLEKNIKLMCVQEKVFFFYVGCWFCKWT